MTKHEARGTKHEAQEFPICLVLLLFYFILFLALCFYHFLRQNFFPLPPRQPPKFPLHVGPQPPPSVHSCSSSVEATGVVLAVRPFRCHLSSSHPFRHRQSGNCAPVPFLFRYRDDAVRPLPFTALRGCGGAHVREGLLPVSPAYIDQAHSHISVAFR